MEAVQFNPQTKQLALVKVPTPTSPKGNQVVVKVAYSGICGTDLHISEVSHLKVGDRVAVDPNAGCLSCDACHNGNYHYCTGGGIEKITAGLTEPLSCVSHGWDRISPIPVGSTILIVGAGVIGNLWAAVLHLQGHRKVIVSEPQEGRRKLLEKLGTGYDIVTPDELKTRRAKDLNWGVDLVIDCSGCAPAIEEAITLINPGGKLCIFGVASPRAKMSVSPYLLYKNELTIIAVKVNPYSFPKALGWIDAMGNRYLDYEKLGIKTYSLSQYKEALQALKDGSIAKAMFKREAKLSYIKAPMPSAPVKNEVLIKVAFAGICGSDIHATNGQFPCKETPLIMGHEYSGVVTAVGSEVKNIKPGDRVAVDPNSPCSSCDACHAGRYQCCKMSGLTASIGMWSDGGWAQYSKVSAEQVHKIADKITLEQAALTEPLSCVAHGFDMISPVPVGSTILIQGAGIIGNLWAAVMHLQGHRKVIISEPQETRRKLAAKLDTGFDIVSPEELRARRARNPEWGVDLVIDCSGFAPALEEAITFINPGGKLCIFGVAPPNARMSVSPYHLYKNEISIVSVCINPYTFPKALGWIDAMGSRYLDYEKLGVKTFSLSQYKEALQALKEGSIAKAMFMIKSLDYLGFEVSIYLKLGYYCRLIVPATPVGNEILIKVAFAGICGTDVHVTHGSFPCRDRPLILGHEFSGVITAVGPDVKHLKPGDHVAVDPNRDGGWAQFCKAPADQVHKLPDNITLEQAALTEPLSCVSHGWDLISPIPVGSKILIVGAGIIGNLWSAVLHLQGHRRVIVSEPLEIRRKLIKNLGE
ncbi:hypothetical protein C0J52_07142 [Blattella germanica]|nr:hypothetical protein C0J52_07142 [Blattella germanica]